MKEFGDGINFSLLETRNETLPSSNSSVYCYEILFELGSLSRDNSEYQYGLCPDTWVTLGVSSSLLLLYLIILLTSIVGIAKFWNEGHIRARSPIQMILTLTATTICVVLACSRMIAGRRLFPCGLYLLGCLIFPQLTIIPSCIRCIRMYLLYILNLKKTKLVELKRTASMYLGSRPKDHEFSEPNSPTSPVPPTFSPDFQTLNSLNSVTTTIDEVFVVNIENEDADSKIEDGDMFSSPRSDDKMISSYSLASHLTSTEGFTMEDNVIRKVDSPPRKDSKKVDFEAFTIESTTIDCKQMDKIENQLEEQHSGVFVRKYQKHINILSFMVSYKMSIPIYIFFLGMHIVLYFILGGVESYFQSTQNQEIFLRPGGDFFLFSHGCGMSLNYSIILVSLMAIYIFAEICCLILSFFGDKDTWNIKRETIALIIVQILCATYFIIGMSVPILIGMVEFFVPSSMAFVVMSICEVFITVFLPVVYSFLQHIRKKKSSMENNSSDLCFILARKRSFKIFLDFARRSFCPEAVICYEHIQHYKKCSKRNRKKVANKILETYLRLGSPLELNYPNLQRLYDDLEIKINSNEIPESNLFDQVVFHCLQDMKELFERFKNQSKEARDILAARKKTETNSNSIT
ncbi:predicted protein [Naegleria gruberi]|uniref:Predicted protein n=1 Tax=Naegleria gruberi TaxID=5762 RepID=D2V091_NAEGR|nr:uncharacterized protein NAEGRDRAFT_62211 [Naegleria gruberi]EFC49485.1 predicted protein [Naegleria gruberi]|eukprot:XP_002682229.1 predicted protein [Naegleria gruberi strain NEG-M]